MSTRSKYWLCQVAGWGIYSATGLFLTTYYGDAGVAAAAGYGLYLLYSIGLTELFRIQIRQRRWLDLDFWPKMLRLGLCVVAIGAIQTGLVLGISLLLQQAAWNTTGAVWLW